MRAKAALSSLATVSSIALLSGCTATRVEPQASGDLNALAQSVAGAEARTLTAAESAENSAESAEISAVSAKASAMKAGAIEASVIKKLADLTPTLANQESVQITRYMGGDASNWYKTDNLSGKLDRNLGFTDLYTRFVFFGRDDPGIVPRGEGEPQRNYRNYKQERPSWLARIFTRQERSVVAVAKISVLDPSLDMTVPLYSVSYNSGGESGESWATAFTSSYVSSPLFRITGNSRFNVSVKTSTSDATESSGFSTAISALTSAVEIVAPEAGLLTTLSEQSTKDRANALDQAISSVLSYSITETIDFGRQIGDWNQNSFITFYGCAPFVRGDSDVKSASGANPGKGAKPDPREAKVCSGQKDIDGHTNKFIGEWRMQMTCPRFSVFSPRSICKDEDELENISTLADRNRINGEIAATVPNSLVLEERMGTNATVGSLIRGSDFFIAFIDNDQKASDDYGKFCAATMDVLRQSGLTGIDAALGLRATLKLMPEFVVDAQDTAGKMQSCIKLLKDHGVDLA